MKFFALIPFPVLTKYEKIFKKFHCHTFSPPFMFSSSISVTSVEALDTRIVVIYTLKKHFHDTFVGFAFTSKNSFLLFQITFPPSLVMTIWEHVTKLLHGLALHVKALVAGLLFQLPPTID